MHMHISEKELEDYIYEDLVHNHGFSLADKGLTTHFAELRQQNIFCKTKWLRQVELGPYGRADIIGFYRLSGFIHVNILELKIVPIECADIEQILRYRQAIKQYFGKRFWINFNLYLVGPEIKSGHYIHNAIRDLSIAEFSYDLDGLSFDQHAGDWYRSSADSFNYLKSLKHAEEIHGYR